MDQLFFSGYDFVLEGSLAEQIRIFWSSGDRREYYKYFTIVKESINIPCTGVCLLVMAIERYILVCRSTDAERMLSKTKHRTLCFLSTASILVGFAINFLREAVDTDVAAFYRVVPWNVLPIMKGLDFLLFFIIPAIICSVLNIRVSLTLKKMMTNRERNLQLTRALAVTTICWLITWTPNVCIEIYALSRFQGFFSRKYEVLQNFSRDFCKIYSALNPIVFIVLIRHLQEPFKQVKDKLCWKEK